MKINIIEKQKVGIAGKMGERQNWGQKDYPTIPITKERYNLISSSEECLFVWTHEELEKLGKLRTGSFVPCIAGKDRKIGQVSITWKSIGDFANKVGLFKEL